MRLAYDKDSGKPRGFGFVEYYDIETAVAAQRHLQGSQIRGRALRLDTAVDDEESLAQIRAAQGGTGGGGGGGGWSGVQRDPLWERASREGPPIGAGKSERHRAAFPLGPRLACAVFKHVLSRHKCMCRLC